ncbi:MAG: hypothetical protein MUE94_13845 [Verrucomicrobia bacterium]|nr:hypothetical protein [Verrucomicrobiota bacterium]
MTLFHKSLLPGYILHNNDNPFGNNVQAGMNLPEGFTGVWLGLNWLGFGNDGMPPDLSCLALWLAGPYGFAKFWQPLSLIILGLCGWVFFKASRFHPAACVLGGLAFALHSDPFSNACWGQVSRPMSLAAMLLALSALQNGSGVRFWLKALLAGAAVGWGLMEGFDVAALLSLVIGAYAVYQVWVSEEGSVARRLFRGVIRLVLVAGFAALVSAQALSTLTGAAIKGASGMEQDSQTKARRWDWATQWSLPKAETLSILVPGLFGYRMDTPDGGNYWGAGGRDPAWDRYFESDMQGPPPPGFLRFGGAGYTSGPVILLGALWALLQSLRRGDSAFTGQQKKLVWFWAGLGLVSLLLAWGRFAPFYQLFYALPFASVIRNPSKFVHITDWAIVVLFGFGVQALSLTYWKGRTATAPANNNGWRNTPGFERKWVIGSVTAVAAALLGWLVYASSTSQLEAYLQHVQFDAATARMIARFSVGQVGWFVLALALGSGVMALVVTRGLAGRRAQWGAILLGAVLVGDMARANRPWIVYWDCNQKYSTNDVLERLQTRPHEGRVVGLPQWFLEAFQLPDQIVGPQQYLDQLYRVQWAQHQFLQCNIQSLDVVQLPRPPQDYLDFESALAVRSAETLPLLTRKWELTNTRYVLALSAFADLLNRQFDPGKNRFRLVETFRIAPRPGVRQPRRLEDLTAAFAPDGPYALIEFAGALPRAGLYTRWQTVTHDDEALKQLADPAFDPARTVLVSEPIPPPSEPVGTDASRVEIIRYEPKRIALKTGADSSTLLLLNDRHTPNWEVKVDGEPAPLLRCNYLMRGVRLPAGEHQVEFVLKTNTRPLKISLAGLGISALLGAVLFVGARPSRNSATAV